ncbi:hypothetical protein [Trichocoleus desertorum]|uniref:hypothetical protein n=1 Tax=Trichocoleus desertorum TaxID=1481672 RepID=UPI0032993B2C
MPLTHKQPELVARRDRPQQLLSLKDARFRSLTLEIPPASLSPSASSPKCQSQLSPQRVLQSIGCARLLGFPFLRC